MKSNFTILFILAALILSGLFVFKLYRDGKFTVAGGRSVAFAASENKKEKILSEGVAEVEEKKGEEDSVKRPGIADRPVGINKEPSRRSALPGKRKKEIQLKPKIKDEDIEFDVVKTTPAKGGLSVQYGEFTLDVGLYRNETVKVSYGIPLNEDGKPGVNADNIVFYAPYFNERKFFKRDWHKWFPEIAGYTIYSFDIVNDIKEVGIRDKCYYFKESGVHDLVFKVQKILEKKFNLKHKNLLVIGESGGGSMAQQLGVHFADRIDAVAMTGGRFYDFPQKSSNVAWLSLHTWGGPGIREEKVFKMLAGKYGTQVLRVLTPPQWRRKGGKHFHHSPNEDTFRMTKYFIKGVVELRGKNGGKALPVNKWPVKEINRGKKVFFPSKLFEEEWKKLPHKKIDEYFEDEKKIEPVCFIPHNKTPAAIVIYIHDPASDNELLLIDNLYYLMIKKNVVACGIRLTDDYFESLTAIEALLSEVQKKEEWKDLPIYVCGSGAAGQLAAVAALRKGERIEKKRVTKKIGKSKITKTAYIRHSRIKKITTINSAYNWPFAKLSIVRTRKKRKCHIPLRMIFSSDYSGQIPKRTKYRKIDKLDAGGSTLGKKWFDVLSEIASGK